MLASFAEFHQQLLQGKYPIVDPFYHVERCQTVPLALSPEGANIARGILRAPLEEILHQVLYETHDKALGYRSVLNVLRANRASAPDGPDAASAIDREKELNGCDWCTGNVRGIMRDSFGMVQSADGRFMGHANFSRQAPINGIVTGDEATHNFLRLTAEDSRLMWETVLLYIERAKQAVGVRYCFCSWNGGTKSAMSVPHCHLNVLGWLDRHCGYAEEIAARCPSEYWSRMQHLHDEIGLGFRGAGITGFASLCPVKEKEVCFQSDDLTSGAAGLDRILQILFAHGTNSFSAAAILAPEGGPAGRRFAGWPRIIWRVVDRGDMRARHTDMGAVEVLGGSTIYAADPWPLAALLRGALAVLS